MNKLFILSMFLLTFLSFCTGQSNKAPINEIDEAAWKQIDSLRNAGLPQSAIKLTDELMKKAMTQKNTVEFVKSLVANMEFRQFVTEDAEAVFVEELEAMLHGLWSPAKSIVHSLTADRYIAFYSANRWKLLQQKVVETNSSDLREMSAAELSQKALSHYLASLKESNLLRKEKTEDYKPLFFENAGKFELRPTLYDVLVVKAVETLLSDALYKEPAQSGSIVENPLILSDLDKFLSIKIDDLTEKNTSEGIKILQDWLQFRKKDGNLDALADADLLRLQMMKNLYIGDNADELFEEALTNLADKSRKKPIYSSILHAKATLLYQLGQDAPNTSENLFFKDALRVAVEAVESYPQSEGAGHCRTLIENIKQPELILKTEKNYGFGSGEGITGEIQFKNVTSAQLNLYKLKEAENYKILTEEEVLQQIEKSEAVKTYTLNLPDEGNFVLKNYEFPLIPTNEPGLFCLIISSTPLEKKISQTLLFSTAVFRVTNLALIYREEKNVDFIAVNRLTGEPVSGAELQIFENNRGKIEKGATLKSDANGRAKFTVPANSYITRHICVSQGADRFVSEGQWWYKYDEQTPKFNERFFLFTDRKIYRPGQVVWFKGILMETDGNKAKSVAGKKVVVSLDDVNGKKIHSQTFVTNEYGSVNGRFVLPNDVLTGSFNLYSERGSTSFSVENYKRPRFEAIINPYNGVAILGEEVKLTGSAIDMTGFPLQGASYRWRVVREQHNWRMWRPVSSEPLASGQGITDETGNFDIKFTATVKKEKYMPFFRSGHHFKIEVDVTDINGETRSATQIVIIDENGYVPVVSLNNQNLFSGNDIPVLFSLKNLSGHGVKGVITYKIESLEAPKVITPSSLWNNPNDKFNASIKRTEDWQSWKTKSTIKEGKITIDGAHNEKINFSKPLTEGVYKITMEIADKNGKIQKSEARFNIITGKDFNPGMGLMVAIPKNEYSKGETAQIHLFSTLKQGTIFLTISNNGKIILERDIKANSSNKTISLPITENMIGSVTVSALIINRNREYPVTQSFLIRNDERIIKVKLSTFREQVTPGSKEKWTLTALDANDKPIKAEMLALMYDASLDQFASNNFWFNMFQVSRSNFPWKLGNSVGGTVFGWNRNNFYSTIKHPEIIYRSYPIFNWNISVHSGRNMLTKSYSTFGGAMPSPQMAMMNDNVEAEMDMSSGEKGVLEADIPENKANISTNTLRSNFNETAFFIPELITNDKGEATFEFTLPESITKWRFMALAHNKQGASGTTEQFITASKELMVVPNLPRIMREGDELTLTAKIMNNSAKTLAGTANLIAKDVITGEVVKLNETPVKWSATAAGVANAEWKIIVPKSSKGILITIIANSELHSDGEERLIPVLPVMMTITETMPVTLTGKGKHNIEMEKLINSKNETNLSFTLTYTQNATWEILDVLPWIIERPHENADQIFNRYFAVTVAKQIFSEKPEIVRILKAWAAALPGDEDALLSALERNPELKKTVLEATPWLTQAKNDTERRKQLTMLVSDGYLDTQQSTALSKLANLQTQEGGWSWFEGMTPSTFITSDIIAGFGYLKKINAKQSPEVDQIIARGVSFLLEKLDKSMKDAIKRQEKAGGKQEIVAGYEDIKNLYSISFFVNRKNISKQENFWIEKIKLDKLRDDVMRQAFMATLLYRYGNEIEAKSLMRSVSEKVIKGERNERYFKANAGPFWYQAPVERQIAVLEMFRELDPKNELVAGLEDWLISQKRTQSWNTTRGTLSAVYALATSSRNLFEVTKTDEIKVGGKTLDPPQTVSGTGYFSQTWTGGEVNKNFGKVEVTKNSDVPSWVSLHWNYQKEEKEVQKGGFLDVNKVMYKMTLNKGVKEWQLVNDKTKLVPGDKIMVQIVVETPQALDFVHVNDKRASSLEPVEVFSGYRYQSGLGYYTSITDAGADFFIDHLPKGKYLFTYELVISHSGITTSGPAVVQCFYAPEFMGNSEGMVVRSGE